MHFQGHARIGPRLAATQGLSRPALLRRLTAVGLQMRIRASRGLAGGTALPAAARRLCRFRFAPGRPAFGALVAVVRLMLSKPDLGF